MTRPEEGLPLVGEDSSNRGLWLGLAGIGLAGILLFAMLEGNRRSNAEPMIAPPEDYALATAPQPGLTIPDAYWFVPYPGAQIPPESREGVRPSLVSPQRSPVRLTTIAPADRTPVSPPVYVQQPSANAPSAPDPGRAAPTIVYDIAANPAPSTSSGGASTSSSQRTSPAIASAAVDRTNLVAQGTLIYAVLETALNSTQSGQARAMISSDVYNAAGTKILIPRGSRVFGEYKADISAGQNRAQVVWGRLIRPDGVTIYLDSPASDQLGRAGIKGRVNTHFGERLLGALLQSTIDFGTAVAARSVSSNDGVVVALPNATQGAASQLIPEAPKPTLTVRHGTRIAVFVARDLDFSSVE
jgi:type IV secretion system protein VirB10